MRHIPPKLPKLPEPDFRVKKPRRKHFESIATVKSKTMGMAMRTIKRPEPLTFSDSDFPDKRSA